MWPRSLASGRPKVGVFHHTFMLRPQEKLLALLKHFLSKSGKYAVQVRRVISRDFPSQASTRWWPAAPASAASPLDLR